jgi:hypothetical protein
VRTSAHSGKLEQYKPKPQPVDHLGSKKDTYGVAEDELCSLETKSRRVALYYGPGIDLGEDKVGPVERPLREDDNGVQEATPYKDSVRLSRHSRL